MGDGHIVHPSTMSCSTGREGGSKTVSASKSVGGTTKLSITQRSPRPNLSVELGSKDLGPSGGDGGPSSDGVVEPQEFRCVLLSPMLLGRTSWAVVLSLILLILWWRPKNNRLTQMLLGSQMHKGWL